MSWRGNANSKDHKEKKEILYKIYPLKAEGNTEVGPGRICLRKKGKLEEHFKY